MPEPACTCPDPWCSEHATCAACGTRVIILDPDDPAFCPSCEHDVMPARATHAHEWTRVGQTNPDPSDQEPTDAQVP